ncbi:hypothetical protein [Marinifilum flexuosum]|uniref:Uncharacterized protein n=1 Tax=Marinifilum flexuosum TaxID=1117708 RepID=A0A419WGK8_9BACT|nr:hypothetical protein [Marinifilum flexuosum]RKD94563.1 hypothetical protein BXY64_4151 [Marinifilum flexuosum]
MYYDIVNNMDDDKATEYDWEIVIGKPRYRWYKYALNSVYMISSVDEKFDIEDVSFDDLDPWYECVDWVAKNDPEALAHIMSKLVDPVNTIVKKKLLENLEIKEYYSACLIVDINLRSKPEPKKRNLNRKKEKYHKIVSKDIVNQLEGMSQMLYNIKTTAKEKLHKKDLQEPLSYLLNTEKFAGTKIDLYIEALVWMHTNTPDELRKLFDFEILIEIKDNFINYLATKELYKLCSFLKKYIPAKEMDFYFDIPPYSEEFLDEDSDSNSYEDE